MPIDETYLVTGQGIHLSTPWRVDFGTLLTAGETCYAAKARFLALIMPALRELCHGNSSSYCSQLKSSISSLLRFLDINSLLIGNQSLSDPDDTEFWRSLQEMWPLYILYLRQLESTDEYKYQITSNLKRILERSFYLDEARRGPLEVTKEFSVYTAFSSSTPDTYDGESLSLIEASHCFKALGKTYRKIKIRFERCNKIADGGTNPQIGSSGANRYSGGTWTHFENRLWVAKNLFPSEPNRTEAEKARISDGMRTGSIPPDFEIAELLPSNTTALARHIGCISYTRSEISIPFGLVALRTGFNPDALARMSITNWYTDSILEPDRKVIIQAYKRGKVYLLKSSSCRFKPLDPYQIINHVISKTEPLRRQLESIAAESGLKHDRERAKLVWLYQDSYGNIRDFSSETVGGGGFTRENIIINSVLESLDVKREDGGKIEFDLLMCRDTWAMFAYRKSSYNPVVTAMSLQHKTLKSFTRYIDDRLQLAEDATNLINLQGRIVSDLRQMQLIGTRLRIPRPESLPRSAKGLVCISPKDPDRGGDPNHLPGNICGAQRCLECTKWFADARSIPFLLRIKSDLLLIKEASTASAWVASRFYIDLEIVRFILSKFSAPLVRASQVDAESMPPIVPLTSVGSGL
ncbi:hypothetical protein QCN27_10285 [Cereibacter sp. SYSU M97828]|nr:hypothetical protein [Cereibacter flavus]